jgi:hypothetical protein
MIRRMVDANDVAHIAHGRAIPAREDGARAALVDAHGELLAVAERDGDWWQPRVVVSGG